MLRARPAPADEENPPMLRPPHLVLALLLAVTALACGGEQGVTPEEAEGAAEAGAVAEATAAVEASAAFLAAAAAEPGARTLASGLVYRELQPGTGPSPTADDTVKVHYHGTLHDGSVFDSSRERGVPAQFPLRRVIPCWTEGVQLMKVGGRSRLVCPASIAYGERGAPPRIAPGAALAFEVELIEIVGR
jgi:FKBP-type peptidyl-prolyl cis-trans isomerase